MIKNFSFIWWFFRKWTTQGEFVKSTARIVEPPRLEYKGFKFKFSKKGDICRIILIRQKFENKNLDGSIANFNNNSGLLLKKKQELRSKYIHGPLSKTFKRKKFKSLFNFLI